MLNSNQAKLILKKNLPGCEIETYIEYKNLFVFQVLINDPSEAFFDPYYSVNKETKEFRDFSIITNGNSIGEMLDLFMESKKKEGDN